jgi:hypothetical protein
MQKRILVLVLALIFAPATILQVQAQHPTTDEAVGHLNKLGDFANTCATKGVSDASILSDCIAVTQDFNTYMRELFSKHRDIIETVLYGSISR